MVKIATLYLRKYFNFWPNSKHGGILTRKKKRAKGLNFLPKPPTRCPQTLELKMSNYLNVSVFWSRQIPHRPPRAAPKELYARNSWRRFLLKLEFIKWVSIFLYFEPSPYIWMLKKYIMCYIISAPHAAVKNVFVAERVRFGKIYFGEGRAENPHWNSALRVCYKINSRALIKKKKKRTFAWCMAVTLLRFWRSGNPSIY